MDGTAFSLGEKLRALTPLLRAIFSKKKIFLVTLLLISFLGWLAVSFMPNKYESSSKVYADTRSLLRPLLHGIAVHSDTDEEIRIIAQNLLSRPNLEEIARESGLYLRYPTPESYEVFLMNFQKDIQLVGSRRQNLFTISYKHVDARTAQKVVELTLQKLVDSTVGQSRVENDIATDFLTSQIAEQLVKLESIEKELVKFKQDNQAYLSYGNSYMQDVSSTRQALREVDIKITEKKAELESIKHSVHPASASDVSGRLVNIVTPYDSQIGQLVETLTTLKIKYTSQHPDLQEIEAILNELRVKQSEYRDNALKSAASGLYVNSDPSEVSGLSSMSDSVLRVRSELNALLARRASLSSWLDDRLNLINVIPDVEARLTSLTREYESTRELYSNLLKRRDSAELSKNVNENTNEVKFRVIEPPSQPLVPAGPSRSIYYALVLFFAFVVSVVVAFGCSQFNTRINGLEHVKQISKIKVIAHFKMYGENRKIGFIKKLLFSVVLFSLFFSLFLLIAHEHATGQSVLYWIKGGL